MHWIKHAHKDTDGGAHTLSRCLLYQSVYEIQFYFLDGAADGDTVHNVLIELQKEKLIQRIGQLSLTCACVCRIYHQTRYCRHVKQKSPFCSTIQALQSCANCVNPLLPPQTPLNPHAPHQI